MHSKRRTAQSSAQHAARLPSDWTLELCRGKPSDRPTSSLRIQTRPNHLALYTTSQSGRLVYFQLMQFPVVRNQATPTHITIVTIKLAWEKQRPWMCENQAPGRITGHQEDEGTRKGAGNLWACTKLTMAFIKLKGAEIGHTYSTHTMCEIPR